MLGNNILNIGASADRDDSIVKKEYFTYSPYTTFLGESEEIRITIQKHEACLLPSDSYLYMKVKVTTRDYDETTESKVKFVKNFPSFLFSDARYELNGVEIDRIRNVGLTSTMKLLTASSQSNTHGYYQLNKAYEGKTAQNKKEECYDLMVPLSIWFGFCDDFQKVIVNSRHELILNRARNSVNCFYDGAVAASATAKVPEVTAELVKLEWKMPYITLSDKMKMNMNHLLSKENLLRIYPFEHGICTSIRSSQKCLILCGRLKRFHK